MTQHSFVAIIGLLLLVGIALFLLPGCSANGRPMRFAPHISGETRPKSSSSFIEGKTSNGSLVSCSFVEFDERGDFLDFDQHRSCEATIRELVHAKKLLLVIYCHGWKNSSQSSDVTHFNAFLSKLAASAEIQ